MKKNRDINTLLKLIRKKANQYVNKRMKYRVGLCSYCKFLFDEEVITTREKEKILKFLIKNRPSNHDIYSPWYFMDATSRRIWLNGQIRKTNKINEALK